MINLHTIAHKIGAFNKPLANQKTFEAVISGGLLSRQELENKGIIPKSNITGLFSDEHENIYFWSDPWSPEHAQEHHKQGSEHFIPFAVTVEVQQEYTWAYNVILRGDVDYFAYQASRLSLASFLQLNQEYEEMQKQHPDKRVIMHYLTGQPLLVSRNCTAYNDYADNAEIPMHVAHVNPDLITAREHPHMFNTSVLKCGGNASFPVLHTDPYKTRGICTNEDCSLVTIPSKFNVPDILGSRSLLTLDGSRSVSIPTKVINLKESISPHYELNFVNYTPCYEDSSLNHSIAYNYIELGSEEKCWGWHVDENLRIKGDDRDNTISLSAQHDYQAIITGGKGADLFCVCPFEKEDTEIQITIVNFDPEEGDRLCLPENVKNSQVWKEDTGISIFVPNAFSAIILPGQSAPIKSAIMTDCSSCCE